MVGEKKVYQGQVVNVVGIVNGDEVVIQFPDGSRAPVYRSALSDLPKPESNRPIITKSEEMTVPPEPVVNNSTEPPVPSEPPPAEPPPAPPADPEAAQ